MKRLFSILLFLFILNNILLGQNKKINLIPNPSFEDENICSKYKEACSPAAWRSSTLKAFFHLDASRVEKEENKANDGNRYIYLCMHNSKRTFDRGFMQTPLLCDLKAGKTYELSFYLKTPFNMLEEFGAYFTDSLIIRKNNNELKGIQTSITFKHTAPISPQEWTLVTGTFKAQGGENILMIGNFNSDEDTRLTALVKRKKKSYDHQQSRTNYLFDNFSLTALDAQVDCDIEKRKQIIYKDNIRHGVPYRKIFEMPVEKTIQIIEEETEEEPEILVIESDSIILSKTFELPNILFESNSDQLLPIAYPSLRKLSNYLQFNREYNISITGHTDNIGSDISNQSLSEKRAKAVQDYLLNQGIFKTRITYFGKGESEPLELNDTEESRAKNRRVEFKLSKKD